MGEVTGDGTAVSGLGGARGFGETALPRGDDAVAQVDVSAVFEQGFTFGGVRYDADDLFISTDGLVSFGAGVGGVAGNAGSIAAPFLAIFNADVDTRLDGEGAESGGVWLDVDTVQDCVTITWDAVGFYRRNASLTNTFQMQLFDRGNGGFEVVFRYQDISWTAGDLQGGWGGLGGTAALLGLRPGATGAGTLMPATGDEALQLALDGALGNTGVTGLWQWDFSAPSLILGTATSDLLHGTSANDTMQGLGGSDVLMGSAGADEMDGGSGSDRVDYGAATTGVLLDLAAPAANTGFAAGDTFVLIEAFAGSGLADTLRGSAGNDRLDGAGGSDIVEGRAGNDSLYGGDGADRLVGGAQSDQLWGEAGQDRLAGGRGSDDLQGGGGADALNGGSGDDTLWGDDGDDNLKGRAGEDTLWGAVGADGLKGGGQNDLLDGGLNDDTMTGGSGADTFGHAGTGGQGTDMVTDFSDAEGDRLLFGLTGATRADFSVAFVSVPGAGRAGVAEVEITYLPTGRVIFLLVDGADEAAIWLQSSMNSFDLL